MTTITNFLHSNFADISQFQADKKQDHQVPIWVLNSSRNKKLSIIKQYIIDNCLNSNKPIVHLDLGLSSFKLAHNQHNHENATKISVDEGLELIKVYKNKPYYLLSVSSNLRQKGPQFYRVVIKCLNNILSEIAKIKTQGSQQCQKYSAFSLLIQSIQVLSTQKSHKNVQSLINNLSSLNKMYRQITILRNQNLELLIQHEFALERISTCVTSVQRYDGVKSEWIVKSTIRRYNGHSNQQRYIIRMLKNNKLKVQKWVNSNANQAESGAQKTMLSQLGFVVKKKQDVDQKQQIKKMIYPHLRVQKESNKSNSNCHVQHRNNGNNCQACTCQHGQPRPEDQGLIILDDEQEDDDDIDV